MASHAANEDGDLGFQIAPMVDVVFVLLLFFMAAAGSHQAAREITSKLPAQQAGPRQDLTVIRIDILPDGRVQLNNRLIDTAASRDLPELREWLKETFAKFGDHDPVVLRPDPSTPHQRIIDVLNSATAAGVTKLTFG
jgi:biopolymer transport protein ExbD